MSTKVAVVGGGPLGLMALKVFKEDGFDVTLYESRSWIGGLWKYSDDEALSTAENTVFNSSKYRAAISDFPVPDEMADYPPAEELLNYLQNYCTHFDLWPHIKTSSPVGKFRRQNDSWVLEIGGAESHTETFDKVAFSCGPFIQPRQPYFEGIENFEGQAFHAMHHHNPSKLKGKRILIIGLHASGMDVALSLPGHASQIYMSHRSGLVMLPRYLNDGSVYDRAPPLWFMIIMMYLTKYVPTFLNWILDTALKSISNKAFPDVPKSWGFYPAPSVAVTPPLIASELYPHMKSGFCEPVPEVARITGPRTVELKSGRILEDIDAIIYSTGYHSWIPVDFEPQDLKPYAYPGATPHLYRNIFSMSPDPAIRNSVAFFGQGGIAFPGFAQFEAQSMAVSQIWQGKSSLPSLEIMQEWYQFYLKWREDTIKKYNGKSTFYTFFLPMSDHSDWVDRTAGLGIRKHFGLVERWTNLDAWRFWWQDRKLYYKCLNGFTSPALFRLFDEGKRKAWSGAREQIFIDDERAERQQKARLKFLEKQKAV